MNVSVFAIRALNISSRLWRFHLGVGMRSVIGPLLLGLLPLVAAGCLLPQQSLSRAESLGFRPSGSPLAKGSRKSKSTDEITFNQPKSALKSGRVTAASFEDDSSPHSDENEETTGKSKITFSDSDEGAAAQESWETDADIDGLNKTNDRISVANRESLSPVKSNASEIGQVRFQTSEEEAQEQPDSDEPDFDQAVPNPSKAEFVDADQQDWDGEPTDAPTLAQAGDSPTDDTQTTDVPRTASVESSLPMWSDRHRVSRSASRSTPSKNTKSVTPGSTRLPKDMDSAEIPSGPITAGTLPMLPWQTELEKLISRIELDLVPPKSELEGDRLNEHIRRHVHLRLLYLMAQRQEQALTAIPGIETSQQEYWQQLIWAVSNNLDTAQFPDAAERAAQTVPPLSGALRQMREQSALSIKNMTFCRKISYFGNYERFPRNEFTPGHEVLLYTEIENFVSALTEDGEYRTSLKSLIEITNSEGQVVWTKGFPSTEDYCRNPRRDYFHNYQFYIPEGLSTGAYSLKLTIVDELSKKRVSNSLNFVLK